MSRRANVTRKSIHRHRDLVALIRAHRPVAVVDADTPPPVAGAETSITAALRDRDHTIAVLHGELDKLHTT